jgi:hypothetical protein
MQRSTQRCDVALAVPSLSFVTDCERVGGMGGADNHNEVARITELSGGADRNKRHE